MGIGVEISLGVLGRPCRLAQHVERYPIAAVFLFAGAAERLADGPPHDELPAEDAHGLDHRPANKRLAAFRHQALDGRPRVPKVLVIDVDNPAGQHQRPGGEVDEQGIAFTEVAVPIGVGQLVVDQAVGGLGIGYAEQSLGQAHEDHSFMIG